MAEIYSMSLTLLRGLILSLAACSCITTSEGQATDGMQTQASAIAEMTSQTASSHTDPDLLRQAVFEDPRLQQTMQEYSQQFGIEAGLNVGAVAVVAGYGLAEWYVVGGDLVNEGHALLNHHNNYWTVVELHTGEGFTGSQASTLLRLGVPEEIIPPLLEAFKKAGADLGDEISAVDGNALSDHLSTQEPGPPYLAIEEVVIGGIALDMDEAAIRQQLGEPLSVVDEETGCCGLLRHLEYPTLSIGLVEGIEPGEMVIYLLETTSPEVATAAGVQVGDGEPAVLDAYGPPHDQGTEGDRRFLTYIVEYDSSRLGFVAKLNLRIRKISTECQK